MEVDRVSQMDTLRPHGFHCDTTVFLLSPFYSWDNSELLIKWLRLPMFMTVHHDHPCNRLARHQDLFFSSDLVAGIFPVGIEQSHLIPDLCRFSATSIKQRPFVNPTTMLSILLWSFSSLTVHSLSTSGQIFCAPSVRIWSCPFAVNDHPCNRLGTKIRFSP